MEHLFIVSYDVSEPKRWRRVYRTMRGYGQWVQLSVFQCRMSKTRQVQLEAVLGDIVNQKEDHVLLLDLGPAEAVKPRVSSIGKPFEPIVPAPVIV
ncbi:MAG: CRISPR-associated endonuclease Cas2 [Syntrophobacterales bacterium]|nr:CRISPR-associated endonuclease Cas2 [Syntrophobacterales bacterium]